MKLMRSKLFNGVSKGLKSKVFLFFLEDLMNKYPNEPRPWTSNEQKSIISTNGNLLPLK